MRRERSTPYMVWRLLRLHHRLAACSTTDVNMCSSDRLSIKLRAFIVASGLGSLSFQAGVVFADQSEIEFVDGLVFLVHRCWFFGTEAAPIRRCRIPGSTYGLRMAS
jgi:hypothetical protein